MSYNECIIYYILPLLLLPYQAFLTRGRQAQCSFVQDHGTYCAQPVKYTRDWWKLQHIQIIIHLIYNKKLSCFFLCQQQLQHLFKNSLLFA